MNIFVKNVEKELHTRKVYQDTEGLVWSNPKTSNKKNVSVFNRLDSLKRHTNVCKNGLVKKEIKCEVCFKTYKSNLFLKKYLKSCKAAKCLECPTCDKKFATLCGL